MLKVAEFKFGVGDVLVPKNKQETAFYLEEIIIDDIHIKNFLYSIIDLDGDEWHASPLMIEKEFELKGGI